MEEFPKKYKPVFEDDATCPEDLNQMKDATKWCYCFYDPKKIFWEYAYDPRCRGFFMKTVQNRGQPNAFDILNLAPYTSPFGDFVFKSFGKLVRLNGYPERYAVTTVDIDPNWEVYFNIMRNGDKILDYFYLIDSAGEAIVHSKLTSKEGKKGLLYIKDLEFDKSMFSFAPEQLSQTYREGID